VESVVSSIYSGYVAIEDSLIMRVNVIISHLNIDLEYPRGGAKEAVCVEGGAGWASSHYHCEGCGCRAIARGRLLSGPDSEDLANG
jgi:hypothetical protein